jgi:hypothetical protein
MRNDQVETLTQLSNDALKVRMKPRRALLLTASYEPTLEQITASPTCKAFTLHC